jgi:hypothetical protein
VFLYIQSTLSSVIVVGILLSNSSSLLISLTQMFFIVQLA